MKNLALALVLVGVAAAFPRVRRDSTPFFLDLPSNASLIVGDIQTGFDCNDLPYGYYADEANDCAIFHVCLPTQSFGVVAERHFSFFCGEGTVFDQAQLVCATPEEALPCSESTAFRNVNEYFGRENVNFNE
ncbi:U-scoloptoxin(01)-Cw1a-like [Homarus americanus]|uniref:U-scoloptoxin(01)-Cw1a-like 24 n=1 Tax=Homarus americanus TaxID=6706 RepID=A0A8J5ML01_HOMAM|nr:U-scoloptoxin(01)-Cw1a-like [Homarus americanus]KAG7155090.1 U-scoloptoxin(01)-Cw1a-like 24 [Homarus americanus]